MKRAVFVKNVSENFRGNAAVYKMEPPVPYNEYNYDTGESKTITADYVVVSATTVPYSGPETYIFPANKDGEILSWGELDGSQRGVLDHMKVLSNINYDVVYE